MSLILSQFYILKVHWLLIPMLKQKITQILVKQKVHYRILNYTHIHTIQYFYLNQYKELHLMELYFMY